MAILSGSDSYRGIHLFIDAHYEELNKYFELHWKKMPAYTTIRNIVLNTSDSESITDAEKWSPVEAAVKVDRFRQVFDTKNKERKNNHETSFYVSTAVPGAKKICHGIRGHRGIENKSYHVRDVSMGEDGSRIRRNPHIFAKLRSFALNILRKNKVKNASRELFRNCMNIDRLFNYSGIF